jgi:hypothetical protein
MFDGAISNGLTNTGTQFTITSAVGNSNFASATGPNTIASANGTLGVAVAQGSNVQAVGGSLPTDVGNAAFNIANDPGTSPGFNTVMASFGNGNVAANLGGTNGTPTQNFVGAFGKGNLATTVGGSGNIVQAFGTSSTAFGIGGTNNTVTAGPGPLDVAGETNQTGQVVTNPPNPHIVG